MHRYAIELTLTEPLLGTVSKNIDLYTDYIASKAPPATDTSDELETVPLAEAESRGWTGFHALEDGAPMIYDYQIKGFFKDAAGMLRREPGTRSSKISAYKKVVDGLLFVKPRRIALLLPEGHPRDDAGRWVLDVLERPLRAQTAQGERIALAKSDIVPAGTRLLFEVIGMGEVTEPLLREWLDYGAFRGLGQWRSASYGRIDYTLAKVGEEPSAA